MIFGRKNDKNSSDSKAHNAHKEQTFVRQALRYSHMPGIIPRIRELGSKFGHFAYMLALVYRAVNLLPANHPYLNTLNIGKYGLRDVIAAAANNVKVDREHIDQIAVFSAVLMSIVLIAAQVVIVGITASVGDAHAATSIFDTPNPEDDVVFVFLTQVFGPDIGVFLTSAASTAIVSVGSPVQAGLYKMLAFYSTAMMVLAVIIIVYYVITVVGEAAVSGTPFGRRFNSLWAPIRLVVAFGLLVPLANGLNSAQYITLYMAKMGSGFATNGWATFVDGMKGASPDRIIVQPNPSDLSGIFQLAFVSEVCAQAYNKIQGSEDVKFSYVLMGNDKTDITLNEKTGITSFDVSTVYSAMLSNLSDAASKTVRRRARATAAASKIRFKWTNRDRAPFSARCGSMGYTIQPFYVGGKELPQSAAIHQIYMNAVVQARNAVKGIAKEIVDSHVELNNGGELDNFDDIRGKVLSDLQSAYNSLNSSVMSALQAQIVTFPTSPASTEIFGEMKARGWGGAALYYTKIGEMNQRFGSLVGDAPQMDEPIIDSSSAEEMDGNAVGRIFRRMWGWVGRQMGSDAMQNGEEMDVAGAAAINVAQEFYFSRMGPEFANADSTGFLNAVAKFLFGARVLYEYKDSGTHSLDPMVGMMSIGDELVKRATRAAGIVAVSKIGAVGMVALGFATAGAGALVVAGLNALGAIAYILMVVGLGAGLFLFYVLPLMPFIYFFFAIAAWIMEIFEAIVAMPLWALSHLKIDGDGLPGQLASNGYFLLLGIFLRPILIVFGLVGGYLVFGGAAYLLGSTFDIVVDNVSQGRRIGAMGQMIFAIVFVYLSYNLAVMCFKMIDNVPKGILRWIGQGGATPFSDEKPDPIQGSQSMIFAAAGMAAYMRPSPVNPDGPLSGAGPKAKSQISDFISKRSGSLKGGGKGGGAP